MSEETSSQVEGPRTERDGNTRGRARRRRFTIFISYRRNDASAEAGRLFDALQAKFGRRVFMDVVDIPIGSDFPGVIRHAVSTCDVALVVIGASWLSVAQQPDTHRLDDPRDWVRQEVALALGRTIPVIPVLVRGASMPTTDQLPGDIRDLAGRNAVRLGDLDWHRAVNGLIADLQEIQRGGRPPRPVRRYVAVGAGLLLVAMLLFLFLGNYRWGGTAMLISPSEAASKTLHFYTWSGDNPVDVHWKSADDKVDLLVDISDWGDQGYFELQYLNVYGTKYDFASCGGPLLNNSLHDAKGSFDCRSSHGVRVAGTFEAKR